jgi:hypothetical protein
LFDVVMESGMSQKIVVTPMRPRAISICAKCPWVKVNPTSRQDFYNTRNTSLDWFVNRCSAALVKDGGGKLVKNENYGKPTGMITGCKEWT